MSPSTCFYMHGRTGIQTAKLASYQFGLCIIQFSLNAPRGKEKPHVGFDFPEA